MTKYSDRIKTRKRTSQITQDSNKIRNTWEIMHINNHLMPRRGAAGTRIKDLIMIQGTAALDTVDSLHILMKECLEEL